MEKENSDTTEKQIPRTTLINRQRTKRNRILGLITSNTATRASYGISRSYQQLSGNSVDEVPPDKRNCPANRNDAGSSSSHTDDGNCVTGQLNYQPSAVDYSNLSDDNYSPIDPEKEWDEHSFETNIGNESSNESPIDDRFSSRYNSEVDSVSDIEECELTDDEEIDDEDNDDDGSNVTGDNTSHTPSCDITEDPFKDSSDRNGVFTLDKIKNLNRAVEMKRNTAPIDLISITIATAIRFNQSYAAVEMMLKNYNWMLMGSPLPNTVKSLWTLLLRNDQAGTTRHWYCSECRDYIGKGKQPTEECMCTLCGPDKPKKHLSYFIQLRIAPQLRSLLSNPDNVKSLRYRFERKKKDDNCVEDIYDGKKYQEYCQPGGFLCNENNFSFTIDTDRCKLSKSSNVDAWPQMLHINEFPPHARKRLTLVVGVWVDSFHPNLNMILKPTVDELNELYETGITWKNPIDGNLTTSKFVTVVCTADSMARAPLLNMNLHMGKYGCTYCYAKGIQMPGPGVHRRYPYSDVLKCRTDTEMRKHMREAYDTKLKVFGFKGLSVLSLLQGFDLHAGVDIDSMHNVFLGIAKLHTSLLLFGKSTDAWYAGKPANLTQINKRLMKIRPPSRISRKPRPVEEWKNWKASEWRNWILYCAVPCLEGIIEVCDLHLLILLSRAMYILNGDSISTEAIDEARSLLKQYVQNFQERYGIVNMKYNVHLLNHLVDTVVNWGPFWAHSAFPFESWNKKIIEKANNANSRALQISTRYLMLKFIEGILHDATVSSQLQEHLRKILTFQSKKLYVTDKTSKFQGIKCDHERPPCRSESQTLNSAGFNPQSITFYERAIIHNITYKRRRKSSEKITRYCDEFVYCRNIAKFGRIVNIVSFHLKNGKINGVFVKLMDHLQTPSNTRQLQNVSISKMPKIFVDCEDDVLVPAIFLSNHKNDCIVRMSNVWETD